MDRTTEIRHGEAVARFLNDESIKEVFASFDQVYFQAWKEANTPAERETLHAKARALDEFSTGLQAIVASGQRATHDIEQERAKTID